MSLRGGTTDMNGLVALADTLEPWLRAFVYRPARLGPGLDGALGRVPVGVKDIIATADMPTQYGSALYSGHVPDRDAAIVERLRSSGAILFGKTVTTEFAWRHPGPTVNPYGRGHTPGGSSSGSAAAVGAGIVPLALGTQTVGSIIRPAAFCGVVGLKPSFGTLPTEGVHPFAASLDHLGLFGRRVDDVAFALPVLAGAGAGVIGVEAARNPRLLLLRGGRFDAVQGPQRAVIEAAARALIAAGATVIEGALPEAFGSVWELLATVLGFEAAERFGEMVERHPTLTSAALKRIVNQGRLVAPDAYRAAQAAQATLRGRLDHVLAGFDALLTVPAPGEAPSGLDDTGDATFCAPWSFTGVPALALPAGWSPNGLPLGVQLVGAFGDDARLLQVGAWVEARLGWTRRELDAS